MYSSVLLGKSMIHFTFDFAMSNALVEFGLIWGIHKDRSIWPFTGNVSIPPSRSLSIFLSFRTVNRATLRWYGRFSRKISRDLLKRCQWSLNRGLLISCKASVIHRAGGLVATEYNLYQWDPAPPAVTKTFKGFFSNSQTINYNIVTVLRGSIPKM